MKCTNRNHTTKNHRVRLLCILCIAALFVTSCGLGDSGSVVLENAYPLYSTNVSSAASTFFADNLCVTDNFDYGTDQINSELAEGAGAFNLDTQEVLYSQNLFGKLYPASTTKILTAYIIIRNCNLNDSVTVSETALQGLSGSSVCGLKAGDVLTVRDLLYGLMLVSGNDAANVLAEYHSGSAEAFAEVMNSEALRLGATNSHFVNPNGLPDEDHYTTVYDMYLIFQEAVKLQEFINLIQTGTIDVSYHNAAGSEVTNSWRNTCRYVNGDQSIPEGFTVIGGKTGTTNAAGYCLVLYSTNSKGQNIISIVFKADGRANLYTLMDQILLRFAN